MERLFAFFCFKLFGKKGIPQGIPLVGFTGITEKSLCHLLRPSSTMLLDMLDEMH